MTIWCVGRNYSEHAKELGNQVPESPLFFIKSSGCLFYKNILSWPKHVDSLHFECELAVLLSQVLSPFKIALALDLTDRKKQTELKKKGEPWTQSKSFINACPMSPWIDLEEFSDYRFEFWQNNTLKQTGDPSLMVFNLNTLIIFLTDHYPVKPGDIILTGTPSGVGPLNKGDNVLSILKNKHDQILIEWPLKIE